MRNSEERHPILETLKFLGFESRRLEENVTYYIRLGLPVFSVGHTLTINGEQMLFKLHFQRTDAENAIRLVQYEAMLPEPRQITHATIGGIDTAQLEQRMQSVNWNRPPDGEQGVAFIRRINDDLIRLQEQSSYGNKVRRLLCLTYWWGTPFENGEVRLLLKQQALTRTFSGDLPNVDTCYWLRFKLSDIVGSLHCGLAEMGIDMPHYVDRKFRACYPADFNLECCREYEEGILQFRIPVKWNEQFGSYYLQNYEAALYRYPQIKHGIYNGIDTAGLQQRMAAIDWSSERSHYRMVEGEPRFTEEIEKITGELQYDLREHPEGKLVSDQLQARYWPASPDFFGIMDPSAWDYFQASLKPKAIIPNVVHTNSAIHLLCGRAVCLKLSGEAWLRIDLNSEHNGWSEIRSLKGFDFDELKKMLEHLPAQRQEILRCRGELLSGMRSGLPLLSGETLYLEAVPEKGTIYFYTRDGLPVEPDVLIRLGWPPSLLPDCPTTKLSPKPPQKGPPGRHRSRKGKRPK